MLFRSAATDGVGVQTVQSRPLRRRIHLSARALEEQMNRCFISNPSLRSSCG